MHTSLLGLTDIAKLLLESGANVNACDNDGTTPLTGAALKGHVEVAKLLIEAGADVNSKNNNGQTALMYASYNGQTEIVKMLIEARVDIYDQDNNGYTALMLASEQGHTNIVELLKDSETKNEVVQSDIFFQSIASGDYAKVKRLIKEGADTNAIDIDGYTALMRAATYGHTEVAKLLIEAGADIDEKD